MRKHFQMINALLLARFPVKSFQNWNYLVLNMLAWLESRPVVREFSDGTECGVHS